MVRRGCVAATAVALLALAGAPRATGTRDSASGAGLVYGSGSNVLLDFYQRHISPVKGGNRCPMYPSCSQYAKMALETEPLLLAYTDICRRLVECGRDRAHYPEVVVNGTALLHDPPPGVPESTGEASEPTVPAMTSVNHAVEGLALADTLYAHGEYAFACLEYLREALGESDPERRDAAALGAFRSAARHLGPLQFQEFATRFSFLHRDNSVLETDVRLIAAAALYRAGQYRKSLRTLALVDTLGTGRRRETFLALSAVNNARLFSFEKALAHADSLPGGNLGALKDSIAVLNAGASRLPSRSPFLAASMSALIPGAGYLYSNRPSTAAMSLVVNGLFAWVTWEMYRDRHPAAGTTALFLGAGWYLGNIRGSARAAQAFNRNARAELVEKTIGDFEVTY